MKYLIFIFVCLPAFADLDAPSTEALSKTQSLLKSEEQRDAYIRTDARAGQADAKVKALSANKGTQDKMYNISSDIFGDIAKETGGDVEKQKKMMDQASTDPEGFYNSLTPEQQNQIHNLAEQIQKESPQKGASLP